MLVCSTALPDRGVELHSTYTGYAGADTAITELRLAPGEEPSTELRSVEHEVLPVTHARRRCLYDHLQRLQGFLAELGADKCGSSSATSRSSGRSGRCGNRV